jgi:hypothetical protein
MKSKKRTEKGTDKGKGVVKIRSIAVADPGGWWAGRTVSGSSRTSQTIIQSRESA